MSEQKETIFKAIQIRKRIKLKIKNIYIKNMGFPGSSDSKESACNVGDLGPIPGLRQSPGVGHGNPLQYPCLENPLGSQRVTHS